MFDKSEITKINETPCFKKLNCLVEYLTGIGDHNNSSIHHLWNAYDMPWASYLSPGWLCITSLVEGVTIPMGKL